MIKTVSKHLYTIEILSILDWMEKEDGFILTTKLPIKIQWGMNKNLSTLRAVRDTYNEFNTKVENNYLDDEHSEDSVNEDNQTIRVVKEKYLNEFAKEKNEILMTENDIDIRQFSIEDFGDADIDLADMSMLSFFIYDEQTKDTETVEGEIV